MAREQVTCALQAATKTRESKHDNWMPGQPRRQPGLLANLQAARAAIFLIERNDNHRNILGETAREIKMLS
jgi:hypothetical protein